MRDIGGVSTLAVRSSRAQKEQSAVEHNSTALEIIDF